MTKLTAVGSLVAASAPSRISLLVAAGLLSSISMASAQVELKTYADSQGYIDVQKLTCNQLANTYQEDADFLGIWYSGCYNDLAKKHAVKVQSPGPHETLSVAREHIKSHGNNRS